MGHLPVVGRRFNLGPFLLLRSSVVAEKTALSTRNKQTDTMIKLVLLPVFLLCLLLADVEGYYHRPPYGGGYGGYGRPRTGGYYHRPPYGGGYGGYGRPHYG